MLNLTLNGARVSYDSLEDAKDAALESGLGLAFWRETLTECAENEAMWNEFLNDLWQSGAEDEAERLDRTFPKDAPRHWLLIALSLGRNDPWDAFLAEWESQGDERIMAVVNSSAFVPWLKQVQPEKHGLLVRAFGADAAKWPNDLLLLRQTTTVIAKAVKDAWRGMRDVVNRLAKGTYPGDELTITLPGGVPMTFCWCPATTSEGWKGLSGGKTYFQMGSPGGEEGRCRDETMHQVSLTKGFWMGKCQVTQAQWESVMHANPSCFKGADQPVEQVSWNKCIEFISRINAQVQATMSLPTEAQWEYSCRAGTTSPYHFGSALNGDKANCDGNSPYGIAIKGQCLEKTTIVGAYEPNAWGLCDMHGNVREWCVDWYGEGYYSKSPQNDPLGEASGLCRVCRGGAWNLGARYCRSACRGKFDPTKGDYDLGLRLVCSKCPSA